MIFLPIDALPQDKTVRSQLLHEYFVGQYVTSQLIDNVWSIDLHFPDFADYYIDPHLLEGLAWWKNGVTISEIPFAVKREPSFQLSLNDSWTLLAWSQWLSSVNIEQTEIPSEIVILHVDDHDDLMSPRVWDKESIWSDAITGESLDLLEPNSVINAIRSGAIGIGSFIVPLLHFIQKVQIRHLCATGYSVARQGWYSLTPTLVSDRLFKPNCKRLAVELQSCQNPSSVIENKNTYRVTADLNEWLKDLPANVPILLHIDMDYFNNRFNGDSDWEVHTNRYDPSREEVIASINVMFDVLYQNEVMDKIFNIAIALSPGFFPAELWEPAIEQIRYQLSKQ
ncbi:hypothetical protein [Merismopedia glauca]|uniref:Arginase n=1 Tax=Merismopedia glauca CCAP 1448/3 TaxID=1296344 RepID=A0A2T1C270_9CYAN|nr:hypothetical protein [Merismopedia glauca]PSB02361.1 hypothetical protein C7B64_13570 [Merismopedia glauca CCAP 1448/3]